eukprot:SAG11_NODE_27737_length_329_cov_1.573913_1_plen_62_part_10
MLQHRFVCITTVTKQGGGAFGQDLDPRLATAADFEQEVGGGNDVRFAALWLTRCLMYNIILR